MLAFLFMSALGILQFNSIPLDSLGIKAEGRTEWYSYTNKQAGFYFGEANGLNLLPYQGWTVYGGRVLKDYAFTVGGKMLKRKDASAVIYPDKLVRNFVDGTVETFTLLDHINAFVVSLHRIVGGRLTFRILLKSERENDLVVKPGIISTVENKLVPDSSDSRWIAVAARNSIAKKVLEQVASFVSPLEIQTDSKEADFIVTCGKSEMEARRTAIQVMRHFVRMEKERADRMQKLLEDSFVRTGDLDFDKALSWAKLSADALITNQGMKGIWAGLPWFNNYWGRDSFISLPGAALLLGNFENAKQILIDYAAKQDTDSTSTNFGRIPNLITPTETIYNTADGTPWFVSAAFDYFTMTGDRSFASTIYPVIKRALLGTEKFHMDSDYFLIHGDQETWMDAVGPDGPYTPRGNRAVEIQSLWLKQLLVTNYFARYLGDNETAMKTIVMAKRLLRNFNENFIDKDNQLLYDHISESGVPDTRLRPNQLFALWIVNNKSVQVNILKTIVEKLTFPWGIASLVQSDKNFHPYHHYESKYEPDAAYHNGTVWLWLSGQLISYLSQFREQDFAFELTRVLSNELLHGKTAGTLPELFDAFPKRGKSIPEESGAFSQAWSLAEFIRTFYQSYLGVRVNTLENSLSLVPRLPKRLGDISFKVVGGNTEEYLISYKLQGNPQKIDIIPLDSVVGTTIRLFLMTTKDREARTAFVISGKHKFEILVYSDSVSVEKDGKSVGADFLFTTDAHPVELDSLQFAVPLPNMEWGFLKPKHLHFMKESEKSN